MAARGLGASHARLLRYGDSGDVGMRDKTRVVGYFSKVQNWNKSKRYGELVARHRGRYAVETADAQGQGALVNA